MWNSAYLETPLKNDEIRLIRLLPGQWTDPIRCELLYTSLSSNAEYFALSYAWGSKRATRTIFVDDHRFPATVNLEGALRHLRHQHERAIYLWVDALSINQDDLQERTHQVQLMGQIYENCVSVFVYLGPGLGDKLRPKSPPDIVRFYNDERDHSYLESLTYGCTESPARYKQDYNAQDVFTLIRALAHDDEHLPILSFFSTDKDTQDETNERMNLFEALRRLMNPPWAPWWMRIWVVQEVTMPKDVAVFCGSVSAPWSMFAKAALKFTKHYGSCCSKVLRQIPRDQTTVLLDFSNRILDIEELRRAQARNRILRQKPVEKSGISLASDVRNWDKELWSSYVEYHVARQTGAAEDRKTLLRLLQKFRNRKASDPRDKVYALLSLVEASPVGSTLVPDYSLGEKAVFIRATFEIIKASNSLSVLSTDIGRKFRNDLPSWVPDWDAPVGQTNDIRVESIELYNTPSSKKGFKVREPEQDSFLSVQNMWIGYVAELHEVMWGDSPLVYRQTLQNWWNAVRGDDARNESSVKSMGDFWRLLCADVICSQSNVESRNRVRRATERDELDFVLWADMSERSPFRRPYGVTKLHLQAINTYRKMGARCFNELDANQDMWLDSILSHPARIWKALLRAELIGRGSHIEPADVKKIVDHRYPDKYERSMVLERALDSLYLGKKELKNRFIDSASRRTQDNAPWDIFLDDAYDYLQQHFGDRHSYVRLNSNSMDKRVAAMDTSIMAATVSRRLILTDNGYMGLAPADAKFGDQVCFIEGGKTPFLIRELKGHPNCYQVVGDCYLQGLMDSRDEYNVPLEPAWGEIKLG